MSVLDNVRQTLGRVFGRQATIANQYPLTEQITPSYPLPTPYNLTNLGYRRNEIVFACMRKRATMFSEPPLKVYDSPDLKTRKDIPQHPLRQFVRRVNPYMTEMDFWEMVSIYVDSAGFSPWEIEFNNIGQPMNLWPMRPDFCSFLRGDGKPIRAIRYEPHGLTQVDIPIEKILLFKDFDPQYPMLRGLSRTMVAMRVTEVDNAYTDFLKIFFQNGGMVSSVLTTDQSLTEPEAERIKARFQQQYGGVRNWVLPAVLGKGVNLAPTGQTFREMMADELDARDEARICMVFDMSPLLISAKIGMGTITENNYREARAGVYEGSVIPRWAYYAGQMTEQLLPFFEADTTETVCGFDTGAIAALQEDRTAKWTRAISAWEKNVVTRDEARAEMQLDAIDNAPVFYRDAATPPMLEQSVDENGNPVDKPNPDDAANQAEQVAAEAEAKQAEAQKARAFFKRRAREDQPAAWDAFKWKWHTPQEAKAIAGSMANKAGALSAQTVNPFQGRYP